MKVRMIFLIICFLLTGCSYGMDMIEGAITERASFSINASYQSGQLTISWSESPPAPDKGFGGYEVYIIPEAWNEYGTYEVIAARHNLFSPNFCYVSGFVLGNSNTRSVSFPLSKFDLDGKGGEYYVRLGIIKMYVEDSDADPKKYYDGSNYIEYINYSTIDKISGYKVVYID